MKKSFKFIAGSVLVSLSLTTLVAEDFSKLDEKKLCNLEANGVEKLIETAKKYNKLAIENKVEFMRFGMKASQYIDASEAALKKGEKEIALVNAKGKETGEKVSLDFAAWRSCSFAVSALTQMEESKNNWKLSSPSDGYKY